MPLDRHHRRPLGLAVFLVIAGAGGFVAAFALTVERIASLADPRAVLACDFSLLVQCGANLESPQGAVFGFPNPLLGIAGFTAVIAVGVGVLAGGRFARWFWALFTVGVTLAFAFVLWLIGQSIFVLGTLCPWCMVVWAVTIPLFYAVLAHSVRAGIVPAPTRVRSGAATLMTWLPLVTILSYLAVAVVAQLRLDVLDYL
ncbi:vitamin K epoxide reductase family protein [Marisediminicola sp. LYQ134]|uniref:vitamin K epoxide reductase family protein n=1 Tax=unclassified Marisediminicola TaxID=2618316 RepID=UPI0039831619